MAHRATSATGKTASVPATDSQPLAETRKRPKRDFLEATWSLFCSIRFAILLNAGLALTAVLGTVIPQMQPGTQGFESALNSFLDAATSRYGSFFTGVLYWAGFFDVYSSLWFRLLVVMTIFSIIICTLNRWQPIMRLIAHPQVRVSDSFMSSMSEKAHFRAVPVSLQDAEQAITSALRKSRYRVLSAPETGGEGVHLYADRDRWSKLVTFVSHGALVMVILAAVGMASMGWREQSVVYPGIPINVGHGTDLSVRNDRFNIDYYPDGTSPREYKETLALMEAGRVVLTKTITVNDPLKYRGINFFLVSFEPILYARGTGPSGESIAFREAGASAAITATTANGVLLDFKDGMEDSLPVSFLRFDVPNHVITLKLKYYQDVTRAANENAPAYVQAYVDQNFDNPIFGAFLPRTGPLILPGYERYPINFMKDNAVVLEMTQNSGFELLTFFFVVMAGGFSVSIYTTFTRCWVKISPNHVYAGTVNVALAGLAEKNKVSFERDFERLAARIRDNLAAGSHPMDDRPVSSPRGKW